MQTIGSRGVFEVAVEPERNRMHLKLMGAWKQADADAYAESIRLALKVVRPGFTILMDMRQAAPEMPWIQQVHLDLQKEAISAGLRKTAEVFDGHVITKGQREKIAEKSGMLRQSFDSMQMAVEWLDVQ
ncbi:MAG: hypothetical protein AB1646_12765 [Thermodesulfobacteriota bacterium]